MRRVGPGWQHLVGDLALLGVFDAEENKLVVSLLAQLLQALGRRLLPPKSGSCADKLMVGRSEVRDLAFLCATLATNPSGKCEQDQENASFASVAKPGGRSTDEVYEDDSSQQQKNKSSQKSKGKGKVIGNIQSIMVDKVDEVPDVDILDGGENGSERKVAAELDCPAQDGGGGGPG